VLQVAKAAVDDARGTAGYSGGEIILFHQKRVLSGASALARYRHAVNAPADYHHLKVLVFQGSSRICR